MLKISAELLADSICEPRITTVLLTYPRIILAEVNTHCMIPKNTASSRAIPVERRVRQVREDPFTPRYLGRNQRGMQPGAVIDEADLAMEVWRQAAIDAADAGEKLSQLGLHKSLANRVMETFSWVQTIVTFTEADNMLNLRVHEDAQDEYFELALRVAEAYRNSSPTILAPGEWHIPFGDRMDDDYCDEKMRLMISSARCARLSYETHNGEINYGKDLELAEGLIKSGHMSPFQHQAQAVDKSEFWGGENPETILRRENALWDGTDVWWAQFRWWRMFRKTLPGENRGKLNLDRLIERGQEIEKERLGL